MKHKRFAAIQPQLSPGSLVFGSALARAYLLDRLGEQIDSVMLREFSWH